MMPVRKKTDPQPKLISLEKWAQRVLDPVPSIYTLRRMAKDCRIVPAPQKVGRSYYVEESAQLVDYTGR